MSNEDHFKHSDKYRTLCDPSFPLLRDDDFAVSKALYDKQLSQHYTELDFKVHTEKGLYLYLKYLYVVSNYICYLRKTIKIKKTSSSNFYTLEFTSSW